MKILFIGAGNMAQAIINGIIKNNILPAGNINIYEIDEKKREEVKNKYNIGIQNEINDTISKYNILILSVKPQIFKTFKDNNIMNKIPNFMNKDQLIVSVMAGITIKKINAFFINNNSIIRIMPNTPALIGKSMSVISPSKYVKKNNLDIVINIFKSIGEIEVLDEKHLDIVTGLSGSGPAYVFTFIEALTQGGVLCGLDKKTAEKLVIQTILGSTLMIDENNRVEDLRHKVTSPGGTTIAGLSVLEKKGFRSTVMEAVKKAAKRSKELGKE